MKHSKQKQRGLFPLGVCCTLVVATVLAVWQSQPTPEDSLEFIETTSSELENPFAESADSKRPVFPYSVVPGGITDVAELRQAAARDRVVAAHYADFDISKARVVKLSAARTAYVSYRMKDRVYWTKKKVTLAKGETLITDGKSYARARCANRVSDTAQAAVSPQEPSPTVMDTPAPSGSPVLMAYLPSSVRYGFAPESLGGPGFFSPPEVDEKGGPQSGGFGGSGPGGGAFLPVPGGGGGAGGSVGTNSGGPSGGGTSSGGGSGSGGSTGSGIPSGGGAPTGGGATPENGPQGGSPGGAGGGPSVSTPPAPGTPGSGTGTPSGGNSSPGNGNGLGGNPPSTGDSTPPRPGGSPGDPSSPTKNTISPEGNGPQSGPPNGGGSTPPGTPSSPEQNPFSPPGGRDDGPPIDVTILPNEGASSSTTPTAPVPEPASIWLLTAGAASLLALRKRKK